MEPSTVSKNTAEKTGEDGQNYNEEDPRWFKERHSRADEENGEKYDGEDQEAIVTTEEAIKKDIVEVKNDVKKQREEIEELKNGRDKVENKVNEEKEKKKLMQRWLRNHQH